MNIEEFKKIHKAKKDSKLKKFENEILQLYTDNYSLKSIAQFLKKNGIKTTFQNVSRFIKSHSENTTSVQKKDFKSNESQKGQKFNSFPKLEKIGKDVDLKDAPDWAN